MREVSAVRLSARSAGDGHPTMANVLLVDESEVARKALRGILARGAHRFAAVGVDAAWEFIQREVRIDLVVADFCGTDARWANLLRRLHQDSLLKLLPVVVYASRPDRAAVRAAMELGVQRFLVKPYREDEVFAEVFRAQANPWRARHFEEERTFCVLIGAEPADLRRSLDRLRVAVRQASEGLAPPSQGQPAAGPGPAWGELAAAAEATGAWGVAERVREVEAMDLPAHPEKVAQARSALDFAARLISVHLDPALVPAGFLTEPEQKAEAEARERDRWLRADPEKSGPVVPAAEVMRRVEALPGCPVVDTSAAIFQMLADGHPSSLIPIMEKVESEPGLAAQVLIAANHLRRQEESDAVPIDDLRLGVELLGEIKLVALGRSFVTVEERSLRAGTFGWLRFWMFQVAVARMARQICLYLELNSLRGQAYTAGLLHDLGKLLLAHLYPLGWRAILEHARLRGIPTAQAERLFIGCTAREMADRFARSHGLPECYRQVMRHLEEPDKAEDACELVAIVALARDVCRRNRLGHDGDQLRDARPLSETPAWAVLAPRAFPGFTLGAFEEASHAACQDIKRELRGWVEAPAA